MIWSVASHNFTPILFFRDEAMDSTRTISELKSAFIWSQVRILSENLQPPENWRDYAVELEEEALPEKVIEDVLHKGKKILLYCNSCYFISSILWRRLTDCCQSMRRQSNTTALFTLPRRSTM